MNEIITNLSMFLPFLVLLYFINLSERDRTPDNPNAGNRLALTLYIIVIIVYSLFVVLGLLLQLTSFLVQNPEFAALYSQDELDIVSKTFGVGTGFWVPSLIAILLFIPAIRQSIAKWIDIDPQNRIHTLSLVLSMVIFIQWGVTLGFGLDTINETIEESSEVSLLISLWSQDLLLFLISLIGVGWLTRRSFHQSMERLGLKAITWKEGLLGLAIGLIMMFIAIVIETMAIHFDWIDPNIQEVTEKSLGPLFESIPGILTLGLAAALGEETIFRGALQPRFGVFYTSILFALMHANYGLSIVTLVIFLLSLILSWARNRYNTTVCMIIHASYNIGIGIVSLFLQ